MAPRPIMLPGESLSEYESLKESFFTDLNPSTAYERAVVTNISNCEWDLIRTYANRDNLQRIEARRVAISFFNTNTPNFLGELGLSADAEALAIAVVDTQSPRHNEANERLTELGHSVGEIVAEAFRNLMKVNSVLFVHISELERRRGRLRLEYEDLRRRRRAPVEEAHVIEER